MIYPEDSLRHFGIFGMKWGIRRYQNEDGTLTEAGKQRYSSREKDVEYAKKYAKSEIDKDRKSLDFWKAEAQKSKDMPATREGIKKRIHISDDDYEDYLREYKTPEGIKKSIVQNDLHEARIHEKRISDWDKKIKELEKVKIDALMSDKQHQKQIDDVFSQANGWLVRSLDLNGLHSYMNDSRRKQKDIDEKSKRYLNEDGTLTSAGKEKLQKENGSLNDQGKEFFKEKFENSDGSLNDAGLNLFRSKMESMMKDTKDYKTYKGDPDYDDIKASYFFAKDMLKYLDQHSTAKVSEIENKYDQLFSDHFDVYLPYLQEQRKKNGRGLYDFIQH